MNITFNDMPFSLSLAELKETHKELEKFLEVASYNVPFTRKVDGITYTMNDFKLVEKLEMNLLYFIALEKKRLAKKKPTFLDNFLTGLINLKNQILGRVSV